MSDEKQSLSRDSMLNVFLFFHCRHSTTITTYNCSSGNENLVNQTGNHSIPVEVEGRMINNKCTDFTNHKPTRSNHPQMGAAFSTLPPPLLSDGSDKSELDSGTEKLCAICSDRSTGRHYKVYSCEGCKNFFRRSVRKDVKYVCPAYGNCPVHKDQRTRCKACRLKKCLKAGMRKEGRLIFI